MKVKITAVNISLSLSNINNCIFEWKSKMISNIVIYLYSVQRYVLLQNMGDWRIVLVEGKERSYPDENYDSDRNKLVMNNI